MNNVARPECLISFSSLHIGSDPFMEPWNCLDFGRVPSEILRLPSAERAAALLERVQTSPPAPHPPPNFFEQVALSAIEEGFIILSFVAAGVTMLAIPAAFVLFLVTAQWTSLATLICIVAGLVLHPLPIVPSLHHSLFMTSLFRYFSFTVVWRGKRDIVAHSAATAPWIGYGVPHGVFPFGNVLCVAAIRMMGIPFVGTSADVVLRVPLLRWLAMLGVVSASKHVVIRQLAQGVNVGLVPDGIAGIFRLSASEEVVAVASRRGAARLAIEHGITINPGYLLGNTAAYKVWHDGTGVLERLSRALRVSLCLFWGRWGLPVPFRTPISFCFGEPIRPPPNENKEVPKGAAKPPVSKEAVEALHEQLLRETRRIYEATAPSYGWAARPLKFV